MRTLLNHTMRMLPLVLVLVISGATPGLAQERHTVLIQDGSVLVDGTRIAPDDLPKSLRTEGLQLRFEFSGTARFEVGGVQYGLEDGRIVELPADEADGVVIFLNEVADRAAWKSIPEAYTARRVKAPAEQAIVSYVEVLDEQAAQFERLSAQLARQNGSFTIRVADELRREAEEAAVMVRAFPRIEVQSYLQGLQHRDERLYERLMREQRMEASSAELAIRIRSSSDENERQSLEASLKERLEDIFELKQQNRRDEIEQLEIQLRELREQLAARERNRDAIIEKRLMALSGRENR